MVGFAEKATLSVIISNYNYENFVGEAIQSALEIDWPRIEIIVADDGSTDGSRRVIESFASKGVKSIFLQNKGQASALQEAYWICSGDWVLFLDSDDQVEPSIIREAVGVMRPGWALIQFQMKSVDAQGQELNRVFPKYPRHVSSRAIKRWVARTGTYPAAPTSGNLLAREFLDKLIPLEEGMDAFIDSYFLSTAPFLGDVLTIAKPMVRYRVHGKNDGAQKVLAMEKISRDLRRHITRSTYANHLCAAHGIKLVSDRWRYSYYNIAMRIASLRLARNTHPIPRDSMKHCLRDGAIAITRGQGLTFGRHVAMAGWLATVALAPRALARVLISWRFAPDSRPKFLQKLINAA